MAVSPDGIWVAMSAERQVAIASYETLQIEASVALPIKGVYGLAWAPDSRLLANVGADGKCRVFAVE